MRNNEDRFVPPDSGESPALQQKSTDSAPLSFAVPTEMVDLPSKGQLYPNGHPLCGKDSVEIKFMTAKEEDILTSKALIKKGVAIDRMLQSLIIDKNIKVEDLLLGDKNALTVAARVSGYGEDYEISVSCPGCEAKSKHTFNLSLLENKKTTALDELGVRRTDKGTFEVRLLKTKVDVEFRLLTGKDEAETITEMTSKTIKKEEANSTSQLKRIIVSVNGETNRNVINNFVDSLPVVDAKLLRGVVREITPDIEMKQHFECGSCGHEEEVEVPFTVEFFWPK